MRLIDGEIYISRYVDVPKVVFQKLNKVISLFKALAKCVLKNVDNALSIIFIYQLF